MKRFAVVAALFLALSGARAEGPDDQYVQIYTLIQEADRLNSGGQPSEALPKYLEAQTALQRFQKGFPDWNAKVVTFRLNYVAGKITDLSARVPAPESTGKKPAAPTGAGPAQPSKTAPSDWEAQLATLTEQARQLQADKAVLEAKLKEALAVQPAALDPRELARAEEKVRALQKENDLLKASLDQEKAKSVPAPDTKALDEARQALEAVNRKLAEQTKIADDLTVSLEREKAKSVPAPDTKALDEARQALEAANRKLAEQTRIANDLARDKTTLQEKLNALAQSPASVAELETTRKALQEANAQIAEQSKLAAAAAAERETLQARVKTLSTEAEAATALRTENQLLKQQLAALKAAPPPADKTEEIRRQLAQAEAQVAALQSDKELLRLEKIALENRVKQLAAPPAPAATASKATQTADAGRIKALERERDDLKKQLAAANKELNSRKGKAAAARMAEIENQLATLRARLAVYEARAVPYTTEELALLNQSAAKALPGERMGGKAPVKELPPGTAALAAEAQRYYANKEYDKAEETYLKVLQHDKKNVPTLANLAAIELDQNHLETAEINIKQAVAQAPEDPYSLFVLGRLKLRQKKYDEAVDAFGLAAKADPQDAQIQNFLGLALSEKGLLGPAEAALRKAIQLDPGYASAHNNLAVVYISQQPPLVELARWHYQKALAAGHPQNPELEKLIDANKPADRSP